MTLVLALCFLSALWKNYSDQCRLFELTTDRFGKGALLSAEDLNTWFWTFSSGIPPTSTQLFSLPLRSGAGAIGKSHPQHGIGGSGKELPQRDPGILQSSNGGIFILHSGSTKNSEQSPATWQVLASLWVASCKWLSEQVAAKPKIKMYVICSLSGSLVSMVVGVNRGWGCCSASRNMHPGAYGFKGGGSQSGGWCRRVHLHFAPCNGKGPHLTTNGSVQNYHSKRSRPGPVGKLLLSLPILQRQARR